MKQKQLGDKFNLYHAYFNDENTETTMKDRLKFWDILKNDYNEKEVITIATPDGAKTFSRQYEEMPEKGFASVIYSCNDEQYLVLLILTEHSLDIAIDALHDENADKNEFSKAWKSSFNKVLAKYSLKILWEKSHKDSDSNIRFITFNYVLGGRSMFA